MGGALPVPPPARPSGSEQGAAATAPAAQTALDAAPDLTATLPPIAEVPADAVADPGTAGVVAEQHARVLAAATEAEQAIHAASATERAQLLTHFLQQEAQADAGRAAASTRITAGSVAARARVSGAGQASRAQIAGQASSAATATGTQVTAMATEARAEAMTQAARATSTADALVRGADTPPTSGDPDVASGQERIGSAAAGRARTELPDAGARTAAAVERRDAERQVQVYGAARTQATSQVQEGAEQARTAIESGETTAVGAVGQASAQATAAVGAAHDRVRQSLASGRRQALESLDRWTAGALARVRTSAGQLAAALQAHGTMLSRVTPRMGRRAAATATDGLVAAGDAAVAAVGETRSGLLDGTSQLGAGHRDAVAGVGDQVAAAFGRTGDAAVEAIHRPAEAFGRTAQQAGEHAGNELMQASGRVTGALAGEHARGKAEASGVVDRAAEQQTAWASDVRSRASSGTSSYADEASRLRGEAEQAPVQRLFGELIAGMRSWLRDKLGDVLGGIISGIILSLPAIAIAVALVFAGPVGWAVLAALFVVGAGLGIYGRFSDYAADHGGQGPGFWEGVALVGLGIADVTGVPYIIEAAVGQRAFAPQPMTTFERWERGTQGVINLALIVTGGAKKLFGRGAGGEPVPGERVPVPGERAPAPGERGPVPGERPPVEGEGPAPRAPMTRARMTELIREIESGRPVEFRPEIAEALRMNAELATAKWVPDASGRIRWASIRNQLLLTRWRFLPRAPEVAQILRSALQRLPASPERAEMLARVEAWVGRGAPMPVPVPAPRDDDAGDEGDGTE